MNQVLPATVGDFLGPEGCIADPLSFSYFTTLTLEQWGQSKAMAGRMTLILSGGAHSDYAKSHGPIEMAGECVFKTFLDYYCELPYSISYQDIDPYSPAFNVEGISIDVHTRMLRRAHNSGPLHINTEKFLLMAPQIGLERRADIYIFCGYDVRSRDGYAFGWTTSERLAQIELSTQIKHSAKCMSMSAVYPMHTLLPSLLN